jgi:hypothetical protein
MDDNNSQTIYNIAQAIVYYHYELLYEYLTRVCRTDPASRSYACLPARLLVMRSIPGPLAETFAFEVEEEREGNHGECDAAQQGT